MPDFLTRGKLADIDPDVYELIQLEAERQARKLILIPSESTAPISVREALGSVFQNIYAEGYPDEDTRQLAEEEILDYTARLAHYRRYSDPRYYKGVEYADIVEELARRRCAEVYATAKYPADKLFVNVQPLSGAPANNAVYSALVNPGDTVMGMNLLHGGHLTHGSSVNRSGKLYNIVHYNVDSKTEKIDYEAVEALALEHKPKIIIAGYSSYPWVPDWARFRAIADKAGAVLLADISHIAGLVAAQVIPSPVGYAQVITFTTHKTLMGPRSAVILTTDAALARKLDKGVFPGEQGGPHMHAIAALAVTLKIARTEPYRQMQAQIIKNAAALTAQLAARGLRIPFGGTDTHMGNVDCKTIVGPDGTPLSGDMAARILDVAGIVLNRNTIPGDKTALFASGIRYGTPWTTQRGLKEPEMVVLADIMADILQGTTPYSLETRKGEAARAKIDFDVLENAKLRVRALAEAAGSDLDTGRHGYPHHFYQDDQPNSQADWAAYDLTGRNVRAFVNYVFASDAEALQIGQNQPTQVFLPGGPVNGTLECVQADRFRIHLPTRQAGQVVTWLRDLSDGYIAFDTDLLRRLPGPIYIQESGDATLIPNQAGEKSVAKPYYIGEKTADNGQAALPVFGWADKEPENSPAHIALRNSQGRRRQDYPLCRMGNASLVHFGNRGAPGYPPGSRAFRRLAHGCVSGRRGGRIGFSGLRLR